MMLIAQMVLDIYTCRVCGWCIGCSGPFVRMERYVGELTSLAWNTLCLLTRSQVFYIVYSLIQDV